MNLVYWTIIIPLLSSLFLMVFKEFINKIFTSILGVGSIFISFIIFMHVLFQYFYYPNLSKVYILPIFEWLTIKNHIISFELLLDSFSLSMLFMILFIGLCINIFSCWYMFNDKEYIKYFSYMNLFISCMISLILSNNLFIMFFSWELVGICSYLLIGFYNHNIKNGYSAIKAFLMTRISDIFFLIAIFWIFLQFHTIDFYVLGHSIKNFYYIDKNSVYVFWITLFLLFGSIGKSAQFPLYTWLTDAMVGPTPTSALIHAATMVTSGVFLIFRVYPFLENVINLQYLVSILGILTFLISSFSAIYENNIKRILAYSTISQIGYMFLSLGVLNPIGAILHLIFHAFFKALLFLSTGFILKNINYEQNIIKLGGLYKKFLFIYIIYFIGSISLISFPLLSSSFYSKSNILYASFYYGHSIFLFLSLLGVFLTAIYIFRMFFLVFHNSLKFYIPKIKGNIFCYVSLCLLAIGCTPILWKFLLYYFFSKNFNKYIILNYQWSIEFFEFLSSLLGIFFSYLFFHKKFLRNNYFYFNYFNKFFIIFYKFSYYLDFFYSKFLVFLYKKLSQLISNFSFYYFIFYVYRFYNFLNFNIVCFENKFLFYQMKIFLFSIIFILFLMVFKKNI